MTGGPRITHLDDFEWNEVRRQQHGDHTASVYEKWVEFSDRYLSLYARWDPGMIVQPHSHNSDHVVFVIEGDMTCGDVHCPPGTHIALDQGDTFGLFVAGPDGVVAVRGDDGRPPLVPGRPRGLRALPRRAGCHAAREPADQAAPRLRGHPELSVMPFGRGSVSLRLYPHNDLPAPAIVDELRAQAAFAADHGFDGVMPSEHHGGFAGYRPNPLQQAGWSLEAMTTGWAAPCPLLLPLRPPALVAEESAWLAARFPVGSGSASPPARSPPMCGRPEPTGARPRRVAGGGTRADREARR